MTLLLAFVFCVVAIGMFTDRLNAKTYAIVVTGAAGVAVLYYGMTRFMT